MARSTGNSVVGSGCASPETRPVFSSACTSRTCDRPEAVMPLVWGGLSGGLVLHELPEPEEPLTLEVYSSHSVEVMQYDS